MRKTSAQEELINEVRLFYQSLVQMSEALHEGSGVSVGMRAVLEYLDRNGDATVPAMARARRVTRQRIQTLVNALIDQKLVDRVSNPASKRSPLIRLTRSGSNKILSMRRLEGRNMMAELKEKDVRAATRTLEALRHALEAR